MNCPKCSSILEKRKRRIRASGPASCFLELLGVIIILTTFWTIIGAVVGLIIIYLGHLAAYSYEISYVCRSCNSSYPAITSM
jgi:hypothetical protein